MQPPSIIGFELFYGIKLLVASAICLILWQHANTGAGAIVAIVYSLLLLMRVSLLWAAIRYASGAVLWLAPTMFVASCGWALGAIGTLPDSLSFDLILVGLAAEAIAVALLFQAGAYYWFHGYLGPKPFSGSFFD